MKTSREAAKVMNTKRTDSQKPTANIEKSVFKEELKETQKDK